MNEIIFNGQKCYTDFKTILNYFKPQPPEPKIIKSSVPFMNGKYDFSTIGTNGELVYDERKISCSLQFVGTTRGELYVKYSQVLSWLLDSGKQQLIYTAEPDYYYLAKVETAPSWDLFLTSGIFVFDFIADPFKYSTDLEGGENILWDTFNFETDVLQPSIFTIVGGQTITWINTGRIVTPILNVSSNMTVVINGVSFNLTTGDNINYRFKFIPGNNTIVVTGTGTLTIKVRKEVL